MSNNILIRNMAVSPIGYGCCYSDRIHLIGSYRQYYLRSIDFIIR